MVHCAIRNDDQSSPAELFLSALETNTLADDPDQAEYGPDEQPTVYGQLLRRIQYFADNGVPSESADLNYLTDGIWEFKRRNKRITFYDTDGSGGWTRKARIDDFSQADSEDEFWRIPNFDEFVRLGHSFLKTSQETLPADLLNADKVRQEDLKND